MKKSLIALASIATVTAPVTALYVLNPSTNEVNTKEADEFFNKLSSTTFTSTLDSSSLESTLNTSPDFKTMLHNLFLVEDSPFLSQDLYNEYLEVNANFDDVKYDSSLLSDNLKITFDVAGEIKVISSTLTSNDKISTIDIVNKISSLDLTTSIKREDAIKKTYNGGSWEDLVNTFDLEVKSDDVELTNPFDSNWSYDGYTVTQSGLLIDFSSTIDPTINSSTSIAVDWLETPNNDFQEIIDVNMSSIISNASQSAWENINIDTPKIWTDVITSLELSDESKSLFTTSSWSYHSVKTFGTSMLQIEASHIDDGNLIVTGYLQVERTDESNIELENTISNIEDLTSDFYSHSVEETLNTLDISDWDSVATTLFDSDSSNVRNLFSSDDYVVEEISPISSGLVIKFKSTITETIRGSSILPVKWNEVTSNDFIQDLESISGVNSSLTLSEATSLNKPTSSNWSDFEVLWELQNSSQVSTLFNNSDWSFKNAFITNDKIEILFSHNATQTLDTAQIPLTWENPVTPTAFIAELESISDLSSNIRFANRFNVSLNPSDDLTTIISKLELQNDSLLEKFTNNPEWAFHSAVVINTGLSLSFTDVKSGATFFALINVSWKENIDYTSPSNNINTLSHSSIIDISRVGSLPSVSNPSLIDLTFGTNGLGTEITNILQNDFTLLNVSAQSSQLAISFYHNENPQDVRTSYVSINWSDIGLVDAYEIKALLDTLPLDSSMMLNTVKYSNSAASKNFGLDSSEMTKIAGLFPSTFTIGDLAYDGVSTLTQSFTHTNSGTKFVFPLNNISWTRYGDDEVMGMQFRISDLTSSDISSDFPAKSLESFQDSSAFSNNHHISFDRGESFSHFGTWTFNDVFPGTFATTWSELLSPTNPEASTNWESILQYILVDLDSMDIVNTKSAFLSSHTFETSLTEEQMNSKPEGHGLSLDEFAATYGFDLIPFFHEDHWDTSNFSVDVYRPYGPGTTLYIDILITLSNGITKLISLNDPSFNYAS